ncbi:MAG: PRC-barrel domain-containing protein [Acidobacteriota bacterium]|nr:PRC-barrel domain-containing protein [Acidobacteriota bacterium]
MANHFYEDLFNSDVVDVNGKKIGSIGQVYLDDQTGEPSWVTVKTGWFGLKETFVPLEQAVVSEGMITVPFTEEKVRDAPRVDPDQHLDADEEARLYSYYGIAIVLDGDQPVGAPEADAPSPEAEDAEPLNDPDADIAPPAAEEDSHIDEATPVVIPADAPAVVETVVEEADPDQR